MGMAGKNKYRNLLGVTILVFVYLLVFEIPSRWAETFSLWEELRLKEAEYLNPDQLDVKTMSLTARKAKVLALVGKGDKRYDQSQAGVIEFLTANAKKAGVRIESVVPNESRTEKDLKTIEFKMELSATYHRIGSFLSEVESGLTVVRIHTLELLADPAGGPRVKAVIQGKAHVLHRDTAP
jgi:Tfp pilus assembly protein PilO